MSGPLSTTISLRPPGMNAFPGDFLGADRQVTPAALVAAEQVFTQLPGARFLVPARKVLVETGADQFRLRNPSRPGERGQASAQSLIESQRNGHRSLV